MALIENNPAVVKKQAPDFLDEFLKVVFKMMIDIDDSLDENFLEPKNGRKADEDNDDRVNVKIG